MLTESLAPSTINRRIGFLKRYTSWGMEQGQVEPAVFQAIREVSLARQQQLAPGSGKLLDMGLGT